jgi:hypothetical protein
MKKNLLFKGIVLMFGFLFFNFQKAPAPPTNVVVDINLSVFVPCADGGGGEVVDFSGQLHVLFDFAISGNRVSGMTHFQPMGLKGVGEVTGDSYNATGVTQEHFNGSLVNGQYELTSVNNFRMIGQGEGNNFMVHETFHGTINANGVITVEADNLRIDCK